MLQSLPYTEKPPESGLMGKLWTFMYDQVVIRFLWYLISVTDCNKHFVYSND